MGNYPEYLREMINEDIPSAHFYEVIGEDEYTMETHDTVCAIANKAVSQVVDSLKEKGIFNETVVENLCEVFREGLLSSLP